MTQVDQLFADEREQEILREAMERLDLSLEGTIRYFCRMGQLVDQKIQQGYKLAWVKEGDALDQFVADKMAPTLPEVK